MDNKVIALDNRPLEKTGFSFAGNYFFGKLATKISGLKLIINQKKLSQTESKIHELWQDLYGNSTQKESDIYADLVSVDYAEKVKRQKKYLELIKLIHTGNKLIEDIYGPDVTVTGKKNLLGLLKFETKEQRLDRRQKMFETMKQKAEEASRVINIDIDFFKRGIISEFELYDRVAQLLVGREMEIEGLKTVVGLGLSQIIMWPVIEGGNGRQLPKEYENQYREIIKTFRNLSEKEIQKRIDALNVKFGSGPTRKFIAILNHKASLQASKDFYKTWGQTIADDIVEKGLVDLSDPENMVLKAVPKTGNGVLILDYKNTPLSSIQNNQLLAKLDLLGIKGYAILAMNSGKVDLINAIGYGKDVIVSEVEEAKVKSEKFIDTYQRNKNLDISEEVLGAVHVLLDKYMLRTVEFLDVYIEITQLFLHKTAMAIQGKYDLQAQEGIEAKLRNVIEIAYGKAFGGKIIEQIERGGEAYIKGAQENVSALFMDIVKYSAMTDKFQKAAIKYEATNPQFSKEIAETFLDINNYFWEGIAGVVSNLGVDMGNILGDATFIPFKADGPESVLAALSIVKELPKINSGIMQNAKFRKVVQQVYAKEIANDPKFELAFKVRFGIQTGKGIAGTLGPKSRNIVTVLGQVVNDAQRCEEYINKFYGIQGIIITGQTKKLIDQSGLDIVCAKLSPAFLIGNQKMQEIYMVEDFRENISAERLLELNEIELIAEKLAKALSHNNLLEARKICEDSTHSKSAIIDLYRKKIEIINESYFALNTFYNYLISENYNEAKETLALAMIKDPVNHLIKVLYRFLVDQKEGSYITLADLFKKLPDIFSQNDLMSLEDQLANFIYCNLGNSLAVEVTNIIHRNFVKKQDLFLGDISGYFYLADK